MDGLNRRFAGARKPRRQRAYIEIRSMGFSKNGGTDRLPIWRRANGEAAGWRWRSDHAVGLPLSGGLPSGLIAFDEPSSLRSVGVVAKRETTAPLACRHLASPIADAIPSFPDLSMFPSAGPIKHAPDALCAAVVCACRHYWRHWRRGRDSITRFPTRHSMCARSRPGNGFWTAFTDPVLSRRQDRNRLAIH